MNYYAGIGSRQTPSSILKLITEIAEKLSRHHYCLRSGGAEGADQAFEAGARHKQIFLPWDGFCGKKVDHKDYFLPDENLDFVEKYHPKISALSAKGLKLMSRNSYQVLGPHLDDPVEFVLCWTKDGKASGGTGQALRIAKDHGIPVFNMRNGLHEFSTYMTFKLLT